MNEETKLTTNQAIDLLSALVRNLPRGTEAMAVLLGSLSRKAEEIIEAQDAMAAQGKVLEELTGVSLGLKEEPLKNDLIRRLKETTTEQEWNRLIETEVKFKGQYPTWWYPDMLVTGIADRKAEEFGRSTP